MTEKQIETIADKILTELPVGDNFMLDFFISKYIKENDLKLDKKERENTSEKLVIFFKENQYILFDEKAIFNDSLNQIGIEAKKAGGHFKYLESLKKAEERENKQDKILELELKLKTFESTVGKKLIIFTVIISFLSFLITVLTLEFWQTDDSENEQKTQVEMPLLNKKEEIQKDSLN